jgi:hypothetical protein
MRQIHNGILLPSLLTGLLVGLLSGVLWPLSAVAADQPLAQVPEPFQGFDPASTYSIRYDDVDGFLTAAVVDTGRSSREKADPQQAKTGTRMKVKVKRSTINEGNRFVYEAFEDDDEGQNRETLKAMRKSLEEVPAQAPLAVFSRDEQLAYWLNLYNLTVLDEIVALYPKRNLKKYVVGKQSIFAKKTLNVAGVPLSLDDIRLTILRQNYDGNPLVLYGLYQGVIGGPNIRKRAYTGENVWRQLEHNATEFVNSNRGTQVGEKAFEVSEFYRQNEWYFADFEADLRAHLLTYLEGPERSALQAANRIAADINDWTITDLYGSYDRIGGSFADNNAALLDSWQSLSVDDKGQTFSSNFSAPSGQAQARAPELSRFSPQLREHLVEIKIREQRANQQKQGLVTVEEMGEAPEKSENSQEQEQ